MLDHSKLMGALRKASDSLFVRHDDAYELLRACWQQIADDPALMYKVRSADTQLPIPYWQGIVGNRIAVAPLTESYTVIAVDGSQVYPDRHQGTACFLINIGSVVIAYNAQPRVQFESQPHVFTTAPQESLPGTEGIDCLRQEYELAAGVLLYKKEAREQRLLLYDGSLIFWHLAQQSEEIKKHFISVYCQHLQELYASKALVAWYISLPKSKDLVAILRAAATLNPAWSEIENQAVYAVDATIASFFLESYTRTTVFTSTHPLCQEYPDHLKPCFFYIDVETEIARVEIPAWLAADEKAVEIIAQLIVDQVRKGRGYPVALAEAHEQAVVKGPDRDFFYHLIAKLSIEQQQRMIFSQKSIKKRGLSV